MTSLQGTDSLGSTVSLVLRGYVQHCHFSILLAKLDMYDSEVPLYSNFPLYFRYLMRLIKIIRHKEEQEEDVYTRWEKDYDLVPQSVHGLFYEYLELGACACEQNNEGFPPENMILRSVCSEELRHTVTMYVCALTIHTNLPFSDPPLSFPPSPRNNGHMCLN